jgi:hypothetical protein
MVFSALPFLPDAGSARVSNVSRLNLPWALGNFIQDLQPDFD